MRYAIISDVHANEAALRAVLTDAADAQAEKIICLGDVLGYGPEPVAALELVYRRAHVCLAGNHDDAVCGRFPVEDFTDFAAEAVQCHRAAVTQEARDWLNHLPYTCAFEGFACAHGDFSNPENFNYILEPQDALPSWEARTEQLLFVGHSHQPGIFVLGASGTPHHIDAADFTLEDGKRYIVNPGSVGYPRSGDCRSSYCIYDDVERTVEFRTLPFDLDTYAAKMHGQGLNEAPWMLARAAERRRPFVRGAAQFGTESGRAALVAATTTTGETPVAPVVGSPRRGDRFPRWAVGLLVLGTLALVGIMSYTFWLAHSIPKDDSPSTAIIPVEEVAPPPPPAPPATELKFGPEENLVEGWKYAVENPDEQKIEIEFNGEKKARVFRIEHAALHTVRFTKHLDLRSGADRLYWNVATTDKRRVGVSAEFQFTTRLVFFDQEGALLHKDEKSRKLSMDEDCSVPEKAVDAVLAIDCFCAGTHDLVIPYFADCPPPKKAKDR